MALPAAPKSVPSGAPVPAVVGPEGHRRFVRLSHTLNTAVVALLLYSGAAITIAHPRFYWGQSGNVDTPALFALPIARHTPYSVWARNLHFAGAWACVLLGIGFVLQGFWSGHIRRDLAPARRSSSERRDPPGYNPLQRVTYLLVIFLLFPGLIVTGLAMSPALVAAFPILDTFGGHQSARTLHFGLTVALVLFLIGHVTLVSRSGFRRGVRAITLGNSGRLHNPR